MAKKTASPHESSSKGNQIAITVTEKSVPRHRKPAAGHAIHHARLRGRELVFSGRAAFFDGKRTDGIVPLRFIPQQTLLRRLAPQGGMGFGDHLRRGPDYGRSRDHRGTTGDIERQRKILCFRPFLPSLRGVWDLTAASGDSQSRKLAVREASMCPSARLTAWDNRTGKPYEFIFEPSLGLIETRRSAPAEDSGYAAGSASNAKTAEPSKFGTG